MSLGATAVLLKLALFAARSSWCFRCLLLLLCCRRPAAAAAAASPDDAAVLLQQGMSCLLYRTQHSTNGFSLSG